MTERTCRCLYCRLAEVIDGELELEPGCGPRIIDTLVHLAADVLAACPDGTLRDRLRQEAGGRLLDRHLATALARKEGRRWH